MNLLKTKTSIYKLTLIASIFYLIGSIALSYSNIGKVKRDHELISDLKILTQELPNNFSINVEPSIKFQVNIEAYAMRYNNLHLFTNNPKLEYLLLRKGSSLGRSEYEIIETNMTGFSLYKKAPNE